MIAFLALPTYAKDNAYSARLIRNRLTGEPGTIRAGGPWERENHRLRLRRSEPPLRHQASGTHLTRQSMIATRTGAALAAAKVGGVALGGPKLAVSERAAATNRALADAYAANVLRAIRQIRRAVATSLHQIAAALNARGITAHGGGR